MRFLALVSALFALTTAAPSADVKAQAEVVVVDGAATASAQAVRLNPPAPSEPPTTSPGGSTAPSWARCPQWWGLKELWGLPDQFDYIVWRESRCDPNAANSCCTGLLQVHYIWLPTPFCNAYSRQDLLDPNTNYCVAKRIFDEQGIGAWG